MRSLGGRASTRSAHEHGRVKKYCKAYRNAPGCRAASKAAKRDAAKTACCRARTAKCVACKKGMSVADYCKRYPRAKGCSAQKSACCKARTAECLACRKKISVKRYCRAYPRTKGCR